MATMMNGRLWRITWIATLTSRLRTGCVPNVWRSGEHRINGLWHNHSESRFGIGIRHRCLRCAGSLSLGRSAASPIMKTTANVTVLATSLLLAGCGKKPALQSSPPSTVAPVTQSAMTAWQQGDTAAAVTSFVGADWSNRPLFASGSTLSLSEDQFKTLPDWERRRSEMGPQIDSLKQLAAAVARAGRDAAEKGDVAQARKHFAALRECGAALDTSDSLAMLRLVGQGMKKRAEEEMSRLTP